MRARAICRQVCSAGGRSRAVIASCAMGDKLSQIQAGGAQGQFVFVAYPELTELGSGKGEQGGD